MSERFQTASIVSIGNEVLCGRTLDSNAAHIARGLREVGIPVVSAYTVPDEEPAIERSLRRAAADADIVLTTGGLGPTDDDLTRQAFARFLGTDLELRDELLSRLRAFFERRGSVMPEKNTIQAYVPAGAQAIENRLGTAPGIRAECEGTRLFAMPGVPGEMHRMLEEAVLPELRRSAGGQTIVVRKLRCYGAGESKIAGMLGETMARDRNPLVNCTAHAGVITLEIVSTSPDHTEAEARALEQEKSLRALLGDVIYGVGEETLAEVVGAQLVQRGWTIAVAESCTGGLLAKLITDVPGSSEYFVCGWVTYSNEAKTRQLGVPEGLLSERGAVSAEVATAMAEGARAHAGADVAVGITGIAGPGGATEQKPVGLVYIGVSTLEKTETSEYVFSHDRGVVRLRAAHVALDTVRRRLRN
jgi:nicotinamide-nucleotide amidase